MAADNTTVKPVDAPALKSISTPPKLAGTPLTSPRYTVTIKNSQGADVILPDPAATRALVALMNVHAVNGGAACHWGGPAAFAEMMAATHAIMFADPSRPWHESYNFVNDAGHAENGIYALRANMGYDGLTFDDLKGFRSISSKLTGHGESHLNPEGVLLSNGPLGSAFPQAQGLAMADKVIGNNRVTICAISDGAAMEGEAKEAFAAIPGLAAKSKLNPFVALLSDNDTKLSGRITKDSFSMHPSFAGLSSLGWHVLHVENGHDLPAVYSTILHAIDLARQNPNRPVCIWIRTIKGYGVKSTEENSAGGHGFPLSNGEKIVEFVSEIYRGHPPQELHAWAQELRAEWEQKEASKKAAAANPATKPAVKTEKIQAGLAKGAIRAAQAGIPVYSISSDVQGSTGISAFQKSFPDRFVEVGIAEANMISVGAGFSKAGFVPVVDTFGQFGVTKGNLPLTMASLSQAPVVAIFSHVGFQDAADGASHQATTYFAAVSSIPHTVVIAPSCANEAEALMFATLDQFASDRAAGRDPENTIFFVGRENYPLQWSESSEYKHGKAQVLREGSDVVLISCGPLLGKIIQGGVLLAEKGIQATVINNPFVNRIDLETIGEAVRRCSGKIVTLEDHQMVGGFGALLSHSLSTAGIAHRMKSLGIPGEFGQSAYLADQLYEKYGMTAQGVVEAAESLILKPKNGNGA